VQLRWRPGRLRGDSSIATALGDTLELRSILLLRHVLDESVDDEDDVLVQLDTIRTMGKWAEKVVD
jgi:hypothetical protein